MAQISKFHIGSKIINADTQTDVGTILHDASLKTVNGNSLVGSGDIVISGGGTVAFTSRLINDVLIGAEDTYTSILSISNVVPGKYLIFINGIYGRSNGSSSRRLDTALSVNNSSDVLFVSNQSWTNAARTSGGNALVGYNLTSLSATVGNTLIFRSSSSTTGISGAQFDLQGMLEISGSENKTISIHAKKVTTSGTSAEFETMNISLGTSMYLLKVA